MRMHTVTVKMNIAEQINLLLRKFLQGNCCIIWKTTLAKVNLTKELPQTTTVVQSEHTEQNSKVPITAPSSVSF